MRTLEIKHVADLLSMRFCIPNYQRGYRWERKHVEALLDDLYAFSTTSNQPGEFYCLQPLAVVKNNVLSTDKDIVYDVIDGQQRLTTLYLLLSYLEDVRQCILMGELATSLFALEYESRDSDFFDKKKFKDGDIEKAIGNIDFFYMTRAYQTIKEWFEKKGINKNIILKVLIPEWYHSIAGLEGDELATVRKENDKENDVRFIWYDVPVKGNTESMEVFSQLNYGKTALTPTDLVKALLLRCDIYTTDKSLMQEVAFRRSCEWDMMEKQLHDPFMWSMFMPLEHSFVSHITPVISLVCDEIYEELSQISDSKLQNNSDDFIYQVCNLYLENNKAGNNKDDYAKNVEKVWTKIQNTYTALYNWYQDADTYHLIGLLVWLKEYKNRDFDNQKRYALLKDLFKEYSIRTKDAFVVYLKQEIGDIIQVKEINEGDVSSGIKFINYYENPLQLIRILVAFNVEEIRTQQAESARFPFHLLREQNITSLEHIHPQHFDLDNLKLDSLRAWLVEKEKSLKLFDKYESYKTDIEQLNSFIQDESTYNDNKGLARLIIEKIDNQFDELVCMQKGQMHTLYNLALVDKDTNAALSNNLLDVKREILSKRHDANGIYVLPATYKVFGKMYSHATNTEVSPKLWLSSDREAYFEAIAKVYYSFISTINKQ